ncbi:50S ribosomal protein L19 [Planctomycetes bacterium Pan216]|uniref:Large ribosomal subunit protein bL19 n=1 Tax=Kolteria novifilia TaxID=2527975 RepID=A0A518AXE4_9BACT|nr:50S ribosomal protein L19 [Planctomycetes bacterium Pan216]
MSIQPLLAHVQSSSLKSDAPEFQIGDTVDVHVRILEGDKERIQIFTGIVIARRGQGTSENFTVRRIVAGEGVERIFPIHSPKIAKVEIVRRAIVRRAKLYYLRDRIGKQAFRLKERPIEKKKETGRARTRVKARKARQAAAATEEAAAPEKKKRRRKTKKTAGDAES